MLNKFSVGLAILFLSVLVSVTVLYKVRSLPDYQNWSHKAETKFFGYFFTAYKYDDSYNWVLERREKKNEQPEEITWHFIVENEDGVIVYFTESTYKPFAGFYFPTKVYERKYMGKCENEGRKALCFQYNKYTSILGVYFTEQSGKEIHLQ